jgi:hypothetical protein
MSDPRTTETRRPAPGRRSHTGLVLWLVAIAVMLAAATWQRMTGPTYPRRCRVEIGGQELRWRLPRSGVTGEPLRVALRTPEGTSGTLSYRRYPTDGPFEAVAMARQDSALVGFLPSQPRAGKLEYYVTLATPAGPVQLPAGEPLVMRFKGGVPLWILLPHVLLMFFSMLIGVRTALAAAWARRETRRTAWVVLVGITIGGMILGPIVQKHAFGAYWTGWPMGGDLTDNKTAAMWIAWIVAVAVLHRRRDPADRLARACVVLAALVMMAVYVIPHSLRGSQLDYSRHEAAGAPQQPPGAGR